MIKTYKRGSEEKLSSNFKAKEFDCKGGECKETLIDTFLIEYLQKIRDHFNKPINITSGYRCDTHNNRVNGAKNSYHKKGMAADIYINGVEPLEIAKYAESIGVLGIGQYPNFVHIDTRTTKSFWYGSEQEYRDTFNVKSVDIEENKNKVFGIDISRWQGDYNLLQARSEGVKFVIVKGGGGDNGLYKDIKFEINYQKAKDLKIPVGCYWFSKAKTPEEAKKEAEYFYNNCLKGKQYELPVYMDVEHKELLALGKTKLTEIIKAFCDYLEDKGMYVGIYSSLSYFKTYIDDDKLQQYTHWVASWSEKCDYKYPDTLGVWQFGGEKNVIRSNKVAGVTTDQDYMFVDFPSIIKKAGKNGFVKEYPKDEILEDKPVENEKIKILNDLNELRDNNKKSLETIERMIAELEK